MGPDIRKEEKQKQGSPLPRVSLLLGIGSIAAFFISLVIGFSVEMIGFASLFRSIVIPLSIAAVLIGAAAKKIVFAEDHKGKRQATLGLIFGASTLGLVALIMIVAFLFFLPLRFA